VTVLFILFIFYLIYFLSYLFFLSGRVTPLDISHLLTYLINITNEVIRFALFTVFCRVYICE